MNRRTLLQAGATVAGSAAIGGFSLSGAFAKSGAITAVMPGVFLPDAIRPVLEGAAGTRVENAPYVSPTDTLAKLLSPGGTSRYDLMISVTEFVKNSVLGEKEGDESVMEIDLTKVPNAQYIMPLFQPDIAKRGDKVYLLPLVWGYDSVVFNTEQLAPEEANTWGVLFDDKHAGRVAWRDDAHSMIMAAGLYMGMEDPGAMSESDLAEVSKFLLSKKKIIRTMWSKFGEAVNLVASGEIYALYGWISMLDALEKQGIKAANNWPKEGLLTWSQSAFIPKDSPNSDAVYKILDAFLSPEYGNALVKTTRYPTTSTEVAKTLTPEDATKFNLDIASRGLKTYPLKWPTQMDNWIEAWNTVKSA